jgi:hypothetical protein
MSKLSQAKKIVKFLQDNPNERFSARDIAEKIVSMYPQDYEEKKSNPRFKDEKSFISQIVAEIGSQKDQLIKSSEHIFWQDKPRPRVYWFDPDKKRGDITSIDIENDDEDNNEYISTTSISNKSSLSEHDLYPILINYLNSEHNLYCMRIDEKKSRNQRGSGGNTWLHPDIVAMQAVDKEWNELVRTCVKNGDGQSVRLWSFEVKITLNSSNVRKSFFQAVSNSSWANEGYLVATAISDNKVEQELRMLSALHGIGVILLNPENPSESEILLPAKSRPEIDWQSVNRILVENSDFRDYIELVSTYYQTGRVRKKDWNK